jgi:hypothetical protein
LKLQHRRGYKEARRLAYPVVEDQLDAIWKALETIDLPEEAKSMLAKIKEVKDTYIKEGK